VIHNFKTFINESFTKIIKSVYQFLKEVGNIDNLDWFKGEILGFCYHNDIPLSKLSGEYLSLKSAIKKVEENSNQNIALFLFNLKRYVSYVEVNADNKLDKEIEEFEKTDFVILVFIDQQPKGLKKLKSERIERQEGSNLNKSDWDYKKDNIKRYKDILYKKRLPETIDVFIKTLLQNYEISDIPKQIKRLEDIIPKDMYSGILNRLYDLKVIDEYEYFKLSEKRFSKWGYYDEW
jgi:hypothetical protein